MSGIFLVNLLIISSWCIWLNGLDRPIVFDKTHIGITPLAYCAQNSCIVIHQSFAHTNHINNLIVFVGSSITHCFAQSKNT